MLSSSQRRISAPLFDHRNRDGAQDIGDHFVGGAPLHPEVRRQDQAVDERGLDERLDVVGEHVVAPVQRRLHAGQLEQRQRAARAGAHRHALIAPRGVHQPHDVALDVRVDMDILDRLAQRQQFLGIGHALAR